MLAEKGRSVGARAQARYADPIINGAMASGFALRLWRRRELGQKADDRDQNTKQHDFFHCSAFPSEFSAPAIRG
jgi:hypothetical protein